MTKLALASLIAGLDLSDKNQKALSDAIDAYAQNRYDIGFNAGFDEAIEDDDPYMDDFDELDDDDDDDSFGC